MNTQVSASKKGKWLFKLFGLDSKKHQVKTEIENIREQVQNIE